MGAAAAACGVSSSAALFPSRVSLAASRGDAAGCRQPISGCGCVWPGRATLAGAGRVRVAARVRARVMISPWAAVELMRQQTSVSCQCHPEGDVSNHGCLPLCLFPITHALGITPSAFSIMFSISLTILLSICSPHSSLL